MPRQRWIVEVASGATAHDVEVCSGDGRDSDAFEVTVDGHPLRVEPAAGGVWLVRQDHRQWAVTLAGAGRPVAGSVQGRSDTILVETTTERAIRLRQQGGSGSSDGIVKSPMPGRVVRVLVEAGATVERGAPVVIVEAMKMENELYAPCDGVVATVAATAGDAVDAGQLLIAISSPPAQTD